MRQGRWWSVSVAGPLIALGRLDLLPVLSTLFREVQVPEAVVGECMARPGNPDAQRIRHGLDSGLLLSVSSQFDVLLITLGDGRLASPCTPWGFAPNPTLAGRQLGHGEPQAQAATSVRKAPRYQGVGFAPVLARSVLARRCRAALRCGLRAGP